MKETIYLLSALTCLSAHNAYAGISDFFSRLNERLDGSKLVYISKEIITPRGNKFGFVYDLDKHYSYGKWVSNNSYFTFGIDSDFKFELRTPIKIQPDYVKFRFEIGRGF